MLFFFSSRRRHTRCSRDWSSDVCSSDLFLRDEHGKRLLAALGPVVDAGEDGILVIKIVVEHGDEWGIKREILLEGARALHLKSDARNAVGKDDVRAAVLFRLRLPFVADRRAVGQQGE